jgi:hypothetical protein
MESPKKKRHKPRNSKRALTLALLGAVLVLALGFWYVSWQKAHEIPVVPHTSTQRSLLEHQQNEVVSITVDRKKGAGYTLLGKDGHLSVSDWPDFVMDSDREKSLLDACAKLTAEDTVSESGADWEPYKADFGLDSPKVSVKIVYTDGVVAAFSLGGKAPDSNLNYFILEGNPGLYLASADLIELFDQDVTAFHHVDQPIIHHQCIDRITIESSGAVETAWELTADITDQDALSAWRMTVPYSYPCDSTAMDTLLNAMEKLYLGSFVSKATEEAKKSYGLIKPQQVITLHQAAGDIATVGAAGTYDVTHFPQSSLTLTVGAAQDEYTDYVMAGDSIYLVSTISQPLLDGLVPEKTLLRQPAAINLDTIASLVAEKGQERREYSLRRQERVLPNNQLATDDAGNVLMDTFVSVNGQDTDFTAFEAAVTSLQSVTVSGLLPADYKPSGDITMRLVFTLTDGRTRTLECVPFDELQDALGVDGTYLYYLPKGALDKGL